VALILAALTPPRTLAQSGASGQETQQLRKELEEMRAQMAKMQERLDQLESANAQPSGLPPAANAAAPPTPQDGTIQTKTPLPQGPTSLQVGRETST